MRTSPLLDALFPEIRGKILAALSTQPEKHWYMSELSSFIGTQPSSLQREIVRLSEAGILKQWQEGRRVYLMPDAQSPVFSDLKNLFERTAGIVPILQAALSPFEDEIDLAFLYGSIARSKEKSESDIDLMIVGTVGLSSLAPILRQSEHRLGRQVNASIYSPDEFALKARKHDHFLGAVLQDIKKFVKGDAHDLARLTGKK